MDSIFDPFIAASKPISIEGIAKFLSDEKNALDLFERWRWPNGIVCPHCKNDEKFYKYQKHELVGTRAGLYGCSKCRKSFTATVGTPFQDHHIGISRLMLAIFIFIPNQNCMMLSRVLGINYWPAWKLGNKIRSCFGLEKPIRKKSVHRISKKTNFRRGNVIRKYIFEQIKNSKNGMSFGEIEQSLRIPYPSIRSQQISSLLGNDPLQNFQFRDGKWFACESPIPSWDDIKDYFGEQSQRDLMEYISRFNEKSQN